MRAPSRSGRAAVRPRSRDAGLERDDPIDLAGLRAGLGSQIPAARQTASGVSATSINDGVQMRHGFGGTLANSIVVFTGAEENVDVASSGEGATAGFDTSDNVANDLIRVVASSFEGTLAGDDQLALDNGDDAVEAGEYGLVSATISDHYNVTGATVASLLVDADSCVGFAPGGTGTPGVLTLGGAGCDPRNATSDPGVIPQDSGLDRSATYRGAFEAGAPLWVDTWTALAQGGLF